MTRPDRDFLVSFKLLSSDDIPQLDGGRPEKPVVGQHINLKFRQDTPAEDYVVVSVEDAKHQPQRGYNGWVIVGVRRLSRVERNADDAIRPTRAVRRHGILVSVIEPEIVEAFEFKGTLYETREEARAAYIKDAEHELVSKPLAELIEKAWAIIPEPFGPGKLSPGAVQNSLTATITALILDPQCGAGQRLLWGLGMINNRRITAQQDRTVIQEAAR